MRINLNCGFCRLIAIKAVADNISICSNSALLSKRLTDLFTGRTGASVRTSVKPRNCFVRRDQVQFHFPLQHLGYG